MLRRIGQVVLGGLCGLDAGMSGVFSGKQESGCEPVEYRYVLCRLAAWISYSKAARISALTSSVSPHSPATTFSSISEGLRAPVRATVTAGLERTHVAASCAVVFPCEAATFLSLLTISRLPGKFSALNIGGVPQLLCPQIR